MLSSDLKEEVLPKNIIILGSTGYRQDRDSAKACQSWTMLLLSRSRLLNLQRSLCRPRRGIDNQGSYRACHGMVKTEHMAKVREKAKTLAEDRLLDLLLPIPKPARGDAEEPEDREQYKDTRERLRTQLKDGKLDSRYVDIEVKEKSMPSV